MKPALVAIFAHPDDESFGPSGTLALYTKTHYVYIVSATRGEAGRNHAPELKGDIGEIRESELRESAKLIGAKDVFFLDYKDGAICNNIYHKMADKIIKIIDTIKPEIILTFESRGLSGHIDHMAMSMIASYVFEKVDYARTLMYYCNSEDFRKLVQGYFIFVPPGYKKSEIHKVIDISSVWDLKMQAIQKHISQKKDAERMTKRLQQLPKEEYFLVVEK